MGDKKSRTKLSVEDKMAMFAYKEEHPDASFTKIAEIFTEKLNKKSIGSGFIVAGPSVNQATSTRKSKQPAITDFFAKKKSIKIECMLTNRLLLAITLK